MRLTDLFIHDQLEQGELPVYDADVDCPIVYSENGAPKIIKEPHDRFTCPMRESFITDSQIIDCLNLASQYITQDQPEEKIAVIVAKTDVRDHYKDHPLVKDAEIIINPKIARTLLLPEPGCLGCLVENISSETEPMKQGLWFMIGHISKGI